MNPETGKVYSTPQAVAAARGRGERLVRVGKRVADLLNEGRRARRARLISARQQRKRRKDALRKLKHQRELKELQQS